VLEEYALNASTIKFCETKGITGKENHKALVANTMDYRSLDDLIQKVQTTLAYYAEQGKQIDITPDNILKIAKS
jgi:hypothetical protein